MCFNGYSLCIIILLLIIVIVINIKIELLPNMDIYEYIKFIVVSIIISFVIYLYYIFICKKNNNEITPEEIII